MIYCWSPDLITLFSLPDGKLLTSSSEFVPEQDNTVDIVYMSKFRYLVIGTSAGELRVHRLVQDNPFITKFKEHTNTITSLKRHPNRDNQFISASLDSTLRIWCLDRFTC